MKRRCQKSLTSTAGALAARALSSTGPGVLLVTRLPRALGRARRRLLAAATALRAAGAPGAAAAARAGLGSDTPAPRRAAGAATGGAASSNFTATLPLAWPPGAPPAASDDPLVGFGATAEGSDDDVDDDGGGGGDSGIDDVDDFLSGDLVGSSEIANSTEPAPSADALAAAAASLRLEVARVGAACVAVAVAVAGALDAELGTSLRPAVEAAGTAKARAIGYTPRSPPRPPAAAGDAPSVIAAMERPAIAPPPPPTVADGAPGAPRAWQAWHCDTGVLTILLSPGVGPRGVAFEAAHTGGGALHVAAAESVDGGARERAVGDARSPAPAVARPRAVLIPRGALAVQVGEAGAILSRGALAAVPHCVLLPAARGGAAAGGARPEPAPAAARAQFVVFTQPAWRVPLGAVGEPPGAALAAADAAAARVLLGLTPPLAGRWTPGDAYADFARRTAAAYYGGGDAAARREGGAPAGGAGRRQNGGRPGAGRPPAVA